MAAFFLLIASPGVLRQSVSVMVEVPTKLTAKQKELLKEFDCLSKEECSPITKGFFDKVKEIFGDTVKK